jgi:hypothetical protein
MGNEHPTQRGEHSKISMSASEDYPRIAPFLWFDANAEEAVDFYLTAFKNSRRLEVMHNTPGTPNLPAEILTIAFELEGQRFTALNGGPIFKFTEAISIHRPLRHPAGRSTNTGRSSRPAAARSSVAGSRTSSASSGRSSPRAYPTSSNIPKQFRPCSR